ncbi:MAG: tRNA 2-thiouridine(34) synthase MnmA [bacterium]
MKIAVLFSGGVDSSVSLKLLKDQGHNITAFYLKIWLEEELSHLGECPWRQDLEYVEKVCEQLNVPFQVLSLQKEYWSSVVSYAINEVKNGRTPSPDLFCNQQIKFGAFFDKIDPSFEHVATGHYAQVSPAFAQGFGGFPSGEKKINGKFLLKKAKDKVKDQTYFLSLLNQKQLARAMFPIGNLLKSEVRVLAEKFDLATKQRKDSQGICFLGKIKYDEFLKHHLGIKKGNLIEFETRKIIGEHEGFWYYTIGQRKGIGLSGGPWYVVDKDTAKNIVYISKNYFSSDKARDTFNVSNFNWISGQKPDKNNLQVKVRHGEQFYNCELNFENENLGIVRIDKRDQGIAPGQFAVFYDDEICLGCGVII